MTKETLHELISTHFKTRRAFIDAFVKQGGQLNESILSSQLSGRRGLSNAWRSAYSIFFTYWKVNVLH